MSDVQVDIGLKGPFTAMISGLSHEYFYLCDAQSNIVFLIDNKKFKPQTSLNIQLPPSLISN